MGLLDPPALTRTAADARYEAPLAAAARGLDGRVPAGKSPASPAPTISAISALPAATPTHHPGTTGGAGGSYAGSLNPEFTFLGGKYVKGGSTFPGFNAARLRPIPFATAGFGGAVVEFFSDAPMITFYQQYNELGCFRVLVDGAEQYRCGTPIRSGTAQAGGASTITLDSAASSVNGFYATRWVRITGGTGAGQLRQVASYVGSTKLATMTAAWATAPDSTSTFEIALHRYDNNTSITGTSGGYASFDWAGERRLRRYRVECSGLFYGVWTGAIDTVAPAPPSLGTPTIWCGDSFSAGTGADAGVIDSLSATACRRLGWTHINASIGGTGYLNPAGTGTLNAYDRLLPPTNAWQIVIGPGNSGGTYTITQGGITTGAVAHNANLATVQAAVDAAFGAGYFTAAGTGTGGYVLIGRSSSALTTPLTVDFSAVTGGVKYVTRWGGEIAPNVPTAGDGTPLPFNIVLANGHNDTVSSGFARSALVTQVTNLINGIRAAYPTARIFVIGVMFLPGGSAGTDATNCNTDIYTACQAALPLIRGQLPFVDTLAVPWMTGSGKIGGQTGAGNSDICCDTDGVHPSPYGHAIYGARLALALGEILGRQINP